MISIVIEIMIENFWISDSLTPAAISAQKHIANLIILIYLEAWKKAIEDLASSGGLKPYMSRGGALRKPAGDMEEEELARVFDELVKFQSAKAFGFGAYNSIAVSQQASAKGLAECQEWLRRLLPLSDGMPKAIPLQQQALRFTEYNGTDMRHNIWAGEISSKILTLFNHWRRLKRDLERRRQCLQKASDSDAQILQELLALEPGKVGAWNKAKPQEACNKAKKPPEEACTKAQKPPEEACNKAQKPAEEACNKAQKLKQKAKETSHDRKNGPGEACDKASEAGDADDVSSEVSLDSKGIPMMLKTPEATKEGAKGSGLAAASSGLKLSPEAAKAKGSPKTRPRGLKQSFSSPKSVGKGGLKESQSPPSARLPLLSKRALTHRSTLQQQAAEAAEKLATRSPPAKERGKRKAKQVNKRPATGKKLSKRPAAAMEGQRLETKPAMKRPASQSAAAAEHRVETPPEQGSEIRPGSSGWLKAKAEKYTKQGYIKGWWGEAWVLLVACSQKQAANFPGGHHAVIDALLPHCEKQGMTKAKLVELRNDMLAQHRS